MCYKKRKGIAWQNELYLRLLQYVKTEKITVNTNTHDSISNEQLKNLSQVVFPKYGHRQAYQEKVRYFLQCYSEIITQDLSNLDIEIQLINAPELATWIEYKKNLVDSMCLSSIRQHIQKFLTDLNYKLTLSTRKSILYQMYSITEDKDIEPWMMKTLNNCLWFNRNEICDDVKLAISNNFSNNVNVSKNEYFHGFAVNEVDISKIPRNILVSIENKLESEQQADSNGVLLNKSNKTEAHINIIHKTSKKDVLHYKKSQGKSHLDRIQKRSVTLRNSESQPVLLLFRLKDTNDQLQLMKKLIILNMVSLNNDALKKYMNGTGRVNRLTKKSILENIYERNIKECYYSLLDLIILKRFLIKQKVKEMRHLLKMNNLNFQKEIEGMVSFCDIETKFYEVLQNIKMTED